MVCNRSWDEMPRMCGLVAAGPKADTVYVNPTTVRYVRPGSLANATTIHFANDQSISVAIAIEEVIQALNVSMNANQI
jgi:hypothetical protein